MAAAFIPVLAAQLTGAAAGKSTPAASIPQSAETLFDLRRHIYYIGDNHQKGVEAAFMVGLLVVAGGENRLTLYKNIAAQT